MEAVCRRVRGHQRTIRRRNGGKGWWWWGGLPAAQKAKEPFFDAAHSQTAAVRGAFYKLIATKRVFV